MSSENRAVDRIGFTIVVVVLKVWSIKPCIQIVRLPTLNGLMLMSQLRCGKAQSGLCRPSVGRQPSTKTICLQQKQENFNAVTAFVRSKSPTVSSNRCAKFACHIPHELCRQLLLLLSNSVLVPSNCIFKGRKCFLPCLKVLQLHRTSKSTLNSIRDPNLATFTSGLLRWWWLSIMCTGIVAD